MTDGSTLRTRIEVHMLTGAVTLWQVGTLVLEGCGEVGSYCGCAFSRWGWCVGVEGGVDGNGEGRYMLDIEPPSGALTGNC